MLPSIIPALLAATGPLAFTVGCNVQAHAFTVPVREAVAVLAETRDKARDQGPTLKAAAATQKPR